MKINKPLFFILLIALFFRFYNFPNNPPALNWDEVAIAYNAHSIVETGKDEFGQSFPLSFRSFDDYKMPVYVYITALSQIIFGYNDFSVRFPAAFFGLLLILVVYHLMVELTKKKEVGLLSGLLLAVLPWHVQFTRYALEASVALFFTITAVLFFIYGVRRKPLYFLFSALLFGLSLFTYLSFRVIVPLIVIVLVVYFWKSIPKKNSHSYISIVIIALFAGLLAFQTIAQSGNLRLKGLTVLNDPEVFEQEYQRIAYEGSLKINIPRRLFHQPNLYLNAGLVLRGYLLHFSSDYLFFDRGLLHFTPNVGLLYQWMLLLIPTGLYFLFRKYDRTAQVVVVSTLLIAPIPASITYDIPHPIRAILLIIPFVALSAIGLWEIYPLIDKRKKIYGTIVLIFAGGILFLSSWNYFRQYQIHLPHERSGKWFYGRKEMTEYLESQKNNYEKIIVSQRVEWPYIFMLYYSKYSPEQYLAEGGTKSGFWDAQTNAYDQYEFRSLREEDKNDQTLYVSLPQDFPEKTVKEHIIYYLDGSEALYFVKGSSL